MTRCPQKVRIPSSLLYYSRLMTKYDEENSFQRNFTKTLMIISAIFLTVNGFGLSFFSNEISLY